jgi:UPF0755 protein
MKRLATITLLAAAGLTAAGAMLAGIAREDLRRYARSPAGGDATPQTVVIEPGRSVAAIAATLAGRGIIQSPLRFKLLARMRGSDRRIQAGEYELHAALAPVEVLERFEKGAVKLYRITVPEGFHLRQIAVLAAQTTLFDREEFLRQAERSEALSRLGISAPGVEGYLFPDTYAFPRGTPPEALIAAMLQRFREVFTAEWERRAGELGLSVHAVVTLASIIEKETGAPEERPLISSVFHNRLRRGMRLEADPTVIYGIPDFDGNLTRRHLETPSPYNTYIIRGLPPGPIASPGRESLRAALYPAATDYLFFVARNDGTHHFSASLEEHHRAVRRFQPAAPPR